MGCESRQMRDKLIAEFNECIDRAALRKSIYSANCELVLTILASYTRKEPTSSSSSAATPFWYTRVFSSWLSFRIWTVQYDFKPTNARNFAISCNVTSILG